MKKHLMDTLNFKGDSVFSKGNESKLYDANTGNWYIDFFTDTGTSSLGYGCAEHMQAIRTLLDNAYPIHAPNLFQHELRTSVAEKICRLTGFDRVFFCNSGTESVEAAIKLARKFQYDVCQGGTGQTDTNNTYRRRIYSYQGGFHGRTYGAAAASDGPDYHFAGFGPYPEEFHRFQKISDINFDAAAAVLIAPVFGHHDAQPYPEGWLRELRDECTNYGTLLIFDEVQTGSGRCGGITYAKKIGVQPDIICLAKGIGMGAPVGAMLASEEIAKSFTPGSHFSTFGGNPISLAFVDVMLDWLSEESNIARVNQVGTYMREAFEYMGWAKNIRGEGMLLAFDLDKNAMEFADRCMEMGLLIGAFRKNALKITPPLNATYAELAEGLLIMNTVYRLMK